MDARIAGELREVAARVRHEHRAIRRMLAALSAECTRLRVGAIPKHELEGAIYDLYVKLDEHLAEEELLLRPLVPRLDPDAAARLHLMFGEHDDQRCLLLSAIDATERGALPAAELIALARRLALALETDIALEEELLVDLRA